MARGFLDASLRTTAYFRNLEQSEKVGVSFLFGEAFTHWFAQEKMGIEHVLHVAGLPGFQWVGPTHPIAPKSGASTPLSGSRPDFVGLRRTERHVFESKGRQRSPSGAAIGKALGQVSTVHSINGNAPDTRCATFFMLKASGVDGEVYDPPPDGALVGMSFDDFDALARTYSFFLDRPADAFTADLGDGFVGVEVGESVSFGIDKLILKAMQDRPGASSLRERRVREVFEIMQFRLSVYLERRNQGTSAGRDGLIIVDKSSKGPMGRLG
jgi:hypothetical protein